MPKNQSAPGKSAGYWAVLAVALIGLATGTVFVWRNAVRPSDGARLEPGNDGITPRGLRLTSLQPSQAALQPGDLLLQVEGIGMQAWTRSLTGSPPARLPGAFGETLTYTIERDGDRFDLPVRLDRYPLGAITARNWGTIVFSLAFLLVAGYVFVRRPENHAGRVLFLGGAALGSSTAWSFGLTAADFMDGTGFWLFKAATMGFYSLYWTASAHFALIFPRPLSILRRLPWLIPALYLVPFLLQSIYLAAVYDPENLLSWFGRWPAAEGYHAAAFLILTSAALIVQVRRSPEGVPRRQIRWVALAGLAAGGGGLLFYILPPLLGLEPIPPNTAGLLALPFPIAIAIAILRHNLFDIDHLVNRALVYSALTASTMALYILGVGALGNWLQLEDRSLLAFLITGLVAVLFQPLRERLQRLVNRWMYGERDDPAAVLHRLGIRLEETGTPESALKGIVETVSNALKLPYVAIELGQETRPAASYGVPVTEPFRLPLVFQGEPVGWLLVGGRGREGELTGRDRALIENIAHQAGVVAHNVRLTADLRRSRQELVTAREEERRRIRRDLHDGLGPQLASQSLTLEAIEKLLDHNPEEARRLLHDLRAQSRDAISDIRRLIYELRPPALDDLGLVNALREAAGRFPDSAVPVRINTRANLSGLPAAVELAAYRIALEAVNNTIRHTGASQCNVDLDIREGSLFVEVTDDGQGFPENRADGVGLLSMRERAEELGGSLHTGQVSGGGARVCARLPL